MDTPHSWLFDRRHADAGAGPMNSAAVVWPAPLHWIGNLLSNDMVLTQNVVASLVLDPLPGRGNIRLKESSPVRIGRKTAVALGICLFELGRYSESFGALAADGCAIVSWEYADGLEFRWTDFGAPPRSRQRPERLRLRLLRAVAERWLGGTLSVEWSASGINCSLLIPRRRLRK
jgi:two-component sensor histidine kinase